MEWGGLNAGEIASKIAVDSVKTYFEGLSEREALSDIRKNLVGAIQSAHKQIISYGKINPEAEGMGTTAVLAQITLDTVHVAWSGDSRAYLFRGGALSQLSKDHSYVQSLLDEGKITKEQAFYHPNSNVITQSLGDEERAPDPSYVSTPLYQNDLVLLCSDGLNAMIEDEAIERILCDNSGDLNACVDKLIQAANEAGGNDNVTIVLNKVVDGQKAPMSSEVALHNASENTLKRTGGRIYQMLGLLVLLSLLASFIWFQQREVSVTPDPVQLPVKSVVSDSAELEKGKSPQKAEAKEEDKPENRTPQTPDSGKPKPKHDGRSRSDKDMNAVIRAAEGVSAETKEPETGESRTEDLQPGGEPRTGESVVKETKPRESGTTQPSTPQEKAEQGTKPGKQDKAGKPGDLNLIKNKRP